MKNFDPYKRTILFFASMINVCMMTALFSYSWYHFYADMMYTYRFYRRGNYVVLALYAVLLFFFSNMYGSLTTIVLIMLWLYFCMYVMLLGGEINVLVEEHLDITN